RPLSHTFTLSLHDALPIFLVDDVRPLFSARRASRYSASLSGSYGAKAASSQYVSKVDSNLSTRLGVARCDRHTFHSRPSTSAARDRKSTRLNSSHVSISYA